MRACAMYDVADVTRWPFSIYILYEYPNTVLKGVPYVPWTGPSLWCTSVAFPNRAVENAH